jgi:hypothetical protein
MFILKKFLLNNKNKVILLLLILGSAFLFFGFETFGTHTSKEVNLSVITQSNIKNTKKSIEVLQESVKSGQGSDEEEQAIIDFTESLKLEEKMLQAVKVKNYEEYYRLNDLENQKVIAAMEKEEGTPGSAVGNVETPKAMSLWYRQVKASGQKFSEGVGQNPSGLGAADYILNGLGGLFGIVLLTLLCGDVLGNEMPQGMRYFHLIKKRKSTIQAQYLLTPVLSVLSLILVLTAVCFIIGALQYGIGSVKYPTFNIGSTYTIYQGELLICRWVYLVLVLLFVTSLGQLLSQFVKKAYISSAIIVLLVVGYSVLETQKFMEHVVKWVPLTYLNVNTILQWSDGQKSWPISGDFLFGRDSFWIGAVCLLACSAIFYILTHFIFAKYNYRKDG